MVVESRGCSNSSRNIITVICFVGDFHNNTILSEVLVDHSVLGFGFPITWGSPVACIIGKKHRRGRGRRGMIVHDDIIVNAFFVARFREIRYNNCLA